MRHQEPKVVCTFTLLASQRDLRRVSLTRAPCWGAVIGSPKTPQRTLPTSDWESPTDRFRGGLDVRTSEYPLRSSNATDERKTDPVKVADHEKTMLAASSEMGIDREPDGFGRDPFICLSGPTFLTR